MTTTRARNDPLVAIMEVCLDSLVSWWGHHACFFEVTQTEPDTLIIAVMDTRLRHYKLQITEIENR